VETESFALQMRDEMSGPAKAIKDNLASLKGSMRSLGDEVLALQAKQLKYKEAGQTGLQAQVGLEIQKRGLAMKGLGNQVKDTTGRQRDLAAAEKKAQEAAKAESLAMDELTGGLYEVAKYAAAAAVGLASLVVAGAALALDAGMFKIRMTNVFTQFRGTAEEGAKTYELVRSMSRTLPIPQEKAFESAQELLALGLQGQNRLHNTVQAIADMQAVMGDAAGSKLKSIIGSAQGTTMGGRFRGVFSVTPAELKEIGLSYDQLSAVLAQKLGKSNAETKQMLMYGRIDAATGIDALNAAIAKGGIGEAAKDALLDPTLLMQQFKSHIKDLFADVEIKPFLRELRNLVNVFDLGNNSGKSMKKGITAAFSELLKVGKSALIGLQIGILTLEGYLLDGAIVAAPMIKEIKKLGDSQTMVDSLAWGFKNMAASIGGVVLVATVVVGALAFIVNTIDDLREADMGAVGLQLMQGLADGIKNSTKLVTDSATDVGKGVLDSIAKAFDSHSPSRKARALGRTIPDGLKLGMGDGDLSIAGNGALTFRAEPQGPGKVGGGKQYVVHVTMPLMVTPGANVDEFIRMAEPAVADMFERVAEEVGRGSD
jgi:hypothetical protein